MRSDTRVSAYLSPEQYADYQKNKLEFAQWGSSRTYAKMLLTGEIIHPKFADQYHTDIDYLDSKDGQNVWFFHYLTNVIAHLFCKIDMKDLGEDDWRRYNKALDVMRGYKFDRKNQIKMPINVPKMTTHRPNNNRR